MATRSSSLAPGKEEPHISASFGASFWLLGIQLLLSCLRHFSYADISSGVPLYCTFVAPLHIQLRLEVVGDMLSKASCAWDMPLQSWCLSYKNTVAVVGIHSRAGYLVFCATTGQAWFESCAYRIAWLARVSLLGLCVSLACVKTTTSDCSTFIVSTFISQWGKCFLSWISLHPDW